MRPYIDIARYYSELMMEDSLKVTRREMVGRDEWGDPQYADVVVVDTFCRLRPIGGSEEVVAGRLSASASAVVSAPYGTDISSADTATVNGEPYNIEAVLPRSPDQSPQVDFLVVKVT